MRTLLALLLFAVLVPEVPAFHCHKHGKRAQQQQCQEPQQQQGCSEPAAQVEPRQQAAPHLEKVPVKPQPKPEV